MNAIPITVDGVLNPGEYLNGSSHGTTSLRWFNDHHSNYDLGDPPVFNDLHWEISQAGKLNVFFEVPGHARRMIWDNGCNYDTGDTIASSGCSDLANDLMTNHGLTQAEVIDVLDKYQDNHHGDVNMSHHTQTDSELFELQESDGSTIFMTHWDGSSNSLGSNYSDHATSYDWVLNNGCDVLLCDAWDITASIEVEWMFNNQVDALAFLDDIGRMRLHLSDEARGLPGLTNIPTPPTPPNPVPAPGTLILLGIGLASLGLLKRK